MSNVSTFCAKFPDFQTMFGKSEEASVLPYMTFLNLGQNCEDALLHLRQIVKHGKDRTPQVVALLDDFNWRSQLVGAVAMAKGTANEMSRAALWRAFDSASWVSPQLAAVAFLVDADFEGFARMHIEAGCPINRERLERLDWLARHSAAGPISFSSHSSKALAALVALCQRLPTPPKWLETTLEREDIHRCLASDIDNGAEIALGWMEDFAKVSNIYQ